MDADIRGWELVSLLERVAAETGWQVYVEPDTTHQASAKFKGLPSGQALRSLLGDLNFALVPQTNGNPRLYVFRTAMHRATRLVRPPDKTAFDSQPRRVPNQLIVRLKPGADIDKWARTLGAKVIGRIPELNAYLLEFDDAAAADAARLQLGSGSDVASVDSNYYFDQPQPVSGLLAASTQPLSLQLKPPGDSGRIVVGLIDMAVQPLGADLDAFLLKQISVAGESVSDTRSPSHGTAMAETILRSLEAVTKGNTSVQILPVDVYGSSPGTTSWNVALGILQAVNNGANVINLSLGSDGACTAAYQDAIDEITERGVVVV